MKRKLHTNLAYKKKLLTKQPVIGSFVKTPHPLIVEVMATAGYDFLVLDGEHGPFDRQTLDVAISVGNANGCAMIVRVPSHAPEHTAFVLDAGAAGIMVPHVNTIQQAQQIVNQTCYGTGARGFAGTTRAANFGDKSMPQHLTSSPEEIVVIAQIEDPQGVTNHADIAKVAGIDALFIGRADLAVGMGINDFFAQKIREITYEILGNTNTITGLYCAPNESLYDFARAGASLFVEGSDHSALRLAAKTSREAVDAISPNIQ